MSHRTTLNTEVPWIKRCQTSRTIFIFSRSLLSMLSSCFTVILSKDSFHYCRHNKVFSTVMLPWGESRQGLVQNYGGVISRDRHLWDPRVHLGLAVWYSIFFHLQLAVWSLTNKQTDMSRNEGGQQVQPQIPRNISGSSVISFKTCLYFSLLVS